VEGVKRVTMHHHTKFCGNRSIRYQQITTFLIFKMVAVRNIDFFGTQCTSSYHTMVLLMDFVHTDKHWNSPCNFVQLCSWVSRIKQYRYLTFATPSRSRVTWCSITEFITNVSTRNIPYKMLFTTITSLCLKNVLPLTCYNLLHKITKQSYAAFHSSRELVFTRSRDPGNHEFTTCQWNAF